MHPSYKSDKPDNCPVCSMKLVKMETAPGTEGNLGHEHAMGRMESNPAASDGAASPTGNSIFVSPQRQQMIGVQTVLVNVVPLAKEIRAVGKVAFDETKITHIHTKVTGYIEEVFVTSWARSSSGATRCSPFTAQTWFQLKRNTSWLCVRETL